MRSVLLTLVVLPWLLFARPAHAQAAQGSNATKVADIKRLLQLTGAGDLGKQVMDQMLSEFRRQFGNKVPSKFWDDFAREINPDDLVRMVVPVYEQNLSREDIQALIKFYESPAGKRFVAVLPKITQQSMEAGQKWGGELGQRVMKKLQAVESESKDGKPASKPEAK